MPELTTVTVKLIKLNAEKLSEINDTLAVEEPLEIRLSYGNSSDRIKKNISVTMRTPGNDEELALGFLFTEGIIKSFIEIEKVAHVNYDENVILIELVENAEPEIGKLERNFYTTSSCGVCGKSSIDSVRLVSNQVLQADTLNIQTKTVYQLPETLRKQQAVFEKTGGLHASALFDVEGNLLELREDVGRHNALDKLIGVALKNKMLPLSNHILLLSGRASFELIQKAVMAGIKIVAAVGAPSSLAVEMAKEFNITLIGFLRDNRCNIYCGENRLDTKESTQM